MPHDAVAALCFYLFVSAIVRIRSETTTFATANACTTPTTIEATRRIYKTGDA